MLNKFISAIILTCSFSVMPITGKEPDNLLFLFISPNKWVGTIRLALTLIVFFISFKTFSKYFVMYPKLNRSLLAFGLIMIAFGLISSLEASLGTVFYDYLKPLDLMIILETGIVATSLALSTVPLLQAAQKSTKPSEPAPKLRQKTA